MPPPLLDLELVETHPYRELLKLAGPLILSMSGLMLMMFVDAVMLSWYSPDAIAAVGAASMAYYGLMSLFLGLAGYASTIVSHQVGAARERQIGAAVWQAVHVSTIAGFIVAACALLAPALFRLMGHAPAIRAMEVRFFAISCVGALLPLYAQAFATFFTGRGETRTLTLIQLVGFAVNLLLDYLLIFGTFGCPRLGVAGAAIATTLAQGVVALLCFLRFVGKPDCRVRFGTVRGWRWDGSLLRPLIRFGLPTGFRMMVEVLGWTLFVAFVGRLGAEELAASTIAWRINGLAFFPVIGLAQAAGIIIGTAQGRRRPQLSADITTKTMFLSEVWTLVWVAIFLALPGPLFGLFATFDPSQAASFARITGLGVVLLRFVAAYCVLDAANIVYMTALQTAGDTRWTFLVTVAVFGLFTAALLVADRLHLGLYAEWVIATVYIMGLALIWIHRFYRGRWRDIRVVEPVAPWENGTTVPVSDQQV